jgi:putative hydrolase of the HAD superfamily
MEKDIQAVIFDLGGTLIEYAGVYMNWPELETPGFEAAYQFLDENSVALPPFVDFRAAGFAILPGRWQAATQGRGNLRLVDLLREVLSNLALTDVPGGVVSAAAERYQTAVCSQAIPLDQAQETLAAIKEQGYRLGLLSNTMFTGAAHEADLRRFGLDGYFETMLFSADVDKWKPTDAPFRYLLDALQVRPSQAVFVGDSPEHDVVGGKEAGLWTIYIRANERFGEPGAVQPDATITALNQLPDLLAGWSNGSVR